MTSFDQPQKSLLDLQFAEFLKRYPQATLEHGCGVSVVSVPAVTLPSGWNKETVTVHFLVTGYPHAKPDCFNVDADLRLASGALPQNAQLQDMPLVGGTLWFSWHLGEDWKPRRDTLDTWMAVVRRRFEALS